MKKDAKNYKKPPFFDFFVEFFINFHSATCRTTKQSLNNSRASRGHANLIELALEHIQKMCKCDECKKWRKKNCIRRKRTQKSCEMQWNRRFGPLLIGLFFNCIGFFLCIILLVIHMTEFSSIFCLFWNLSLFKASRQLGNGQLGNGQLENGQLECWRNERYHSHSVFSAHNQTDAW